MSEVNNKYRGTQVKTLVDKDFRINNKKVFVKQSVFRGKAGLVKFYTNWCPHCTDMVEGLTFLAENLKKYDIAFGAVECEGDTTVADTLEVDALPSIFLVKKNGRLKPYSGATDVESLLDAIIEENS